MKILILDSGPLINLSMNGLLYILNELKTPELKFLITHEVKFEVIDRPSKIQRFKLGALRVKKLLDNKIIELPDSIIPHNEIHNNMQTIMQTANHSIKANGKWIKLISEAETSCLALSIALSKNKIENIIAIDERTTRILSEKPQNLEKLISKKLHTKATLIQPTKLPKFKFIRSSELVYAAYKKGVTRVKGPKALEALIYATKFKGASISWDEVNVLKKL
jgi:hypothetical protein